MNSMAILTVMLTKLITKNQYYRNRLKWLAMLPYMEPMNNIIKRTIKDDCISTKVN